VIVTAHSGAVCEAGNPSQRCDGEIIDVARRLRHRPDLIVAGHTHAQVNTTVNGVRIVQSSSNGTRFSIVDLERVSPEHVVVHVPSQPATYADEIVADSAVASLVARWDEAVGPRVNEVIASFPEPLRRDGVESALGNLIADAQRAAVGTQVAIMNNGGIRTDLERGEVTYTDLFRLQPFANSLVTMRLTGAQLQAALEHSLGSRGRPSVHVSGLLVDYDPTSPVGERIRSLRLENGTRVLPEERYSVAVNNFLAEGGSGFTMFHGGTEVLRTGIIDLDALIAYLRSTDPPPVPTTARFRIGG
jgi:5'-nucleotidase